MPLLKDTDKTAKNTMNIQVLPSLRQVLDFELFRSDFQTVGGVLTFY